MEIIDYVNKYAYKVIWSEEDKVHIALCLELEGLEAHGEITQEALIEMKKVVFRTLRRMQEDSLDLPRPVSLLEKDELLIEAKKWARKQMPEPELSGRVLSSTEITQRLKK